VGNDKVQKAPVRPGDTVTCGSLVLRLVPDTTPRTTGNLSSMTSSSSGLAPLPPRAPTTPLVGSGAFGAPPPCAPPPPAPSPPQAHAPLPVAVAAPPPATVAPPARVEAQAEPNALLRGPFAAPHATTGQPSSLAEELRRERQKRTDAERALDDAVKDATLLKRKLDQVQADLKRLRGGQPAPAEDARDDGELQSLRARVAELETQLRRARASEPSAAPPSSPRAPADPEAADAAIALGDSLAELRASLRAANDEAGLLTAPAESVAVVSEALRSAAEQLEAARSHLRALGRLLGVS
jgi:hypothetical protein